LIKNKKFLSEKLSDIPDKLDAYNLLPEINNINSLTELEDLVNINENNLNLIDLKHGKKEQIKEEHKKIKEIGEDDVSIELETDNLFVYIPTSEAGSKYYGSGTRWCTASNTRNMYKSYSKKGPLYIIQSKKNKEDKYQLHFVTEQFMNNKDKPINIFFLLKHFNDIKLTNFINCLRKKKFIEIKKNGENKVIIRLETDNLFVFTPFNKAGYKYYGYDTMWDVSYENIQSKFLYIVQSKKNKEDKYLLNLNFKSLINANNDILTISALLEHFKDKKLTYFIKKIISQFIDDNVVEFYNIDFFNIDNIFLNMTKIQVNSIEDINSELFSKLTNLQWLTFDNEFNQPIGNSLSKFINLEQITFGYEFNQLIGNSLSKLINLKQLKFGCEFNQPIGNSLSKLINLEQLTFGCNFNKPIGESLYGLVNLRQLTFGYSLIYNSIFENQFNQPLDNSLFKLINLEQLTFGKAFNQPLENSLSKLINLKQLQFGCDFNQPIGNSLYGLIKLEQLTFGNKFNQPIGNSLSELINLKQLTFDDEFNQPIGNSLSKLINLKQLKFGYRFKQPLVESLLKLTKNDDNDDDDRISNSDDDDYYLRKNG